MANPWEVGPDGLAKKDEELLEDAPSLAESASPWQVGRDGEYTPDPALPMPTPTASVTPTGAMPMPAPSAQVMPLSERLRADPEFAQLYNLRRSMSNMRTNAAGIMGGGNAEQLARADRELMAALTSRYDMTEAEMADNLTRTAQQAESQNPLAAEQARQEQAAAPAPIERGEERYNEAISEEDAQTPYGRTVAKAVGGVAKLGSDALEPFHLPQMFGFALQDAFLEPEGEERSLTEKWNRFTDNMDDIEYGKVFSHYRPDAIFRPKEFARQHFTGEEISRVWANHYGMELSDRQHKVIGFANDLFNDPSLVGGFIKLASGGLRVAGVASRATDTARGAEAVMGGSRVTREVDDAATTLYKFGDKVEREINPFRVAARGYKAVAPQKAQEYVSRHLEGMMEKVLNREVGIGRGRERQTVARLGTSEGGMFWNMDKDYLTGQHTWEQHDAAAKAGVPVEEMFPREVVPGTRTPPELRDSNQRAQFAVDESLAAVQQGLRNFFEVFGNDRGKEWVRNTGKQIARVRKVIENPDLSRFDPEMRDAILNATMDAAHEVGIAMRPGAQKNLMGVTQKNLSARLLFEKTNRQSPYLESIGAEVADKANRAPPASSLIDREQRTKLRTLAERKGLDPDEVEAVYDAGTDALIANDVLIGYHTSLYAPVKDSFYEEVALRGGTFEQAQDIWDNVLDAALRDEDAMEVGLTADLRVIKPYGSKGPRREGVMDVTDEGEEIPAKAVLKAGDLLNRLTAGTGLNFNQYFRDYVQGHFRNTYAVHQAQRNPEQYIKSLEKAELIRAPVLSNKVYGEQLTEAGFGPESELITQYMDSVNHVRRGERGLLVQRERLREHLMASGITADRAGQSLRKLSELVAPENMKPIIRGEWAAKNYPKDVDMRSFIRESTKTVQTGYGIAAQRMERPKMRGIELETLDNPAGLPESFPFAQLPKGTTGDARKQIALENERLLQIQNRIDQLKGAAVSPTATPAETLADSASELAKLEEEMAGIRGIRELRNSGYAGAEGDAARANYDMDLEAYENHQSILGQIYEPMVSLGEASEYMTRHYPVRQFISDQYVLARRGGYVKALKQGKGRVTIPEGWREVRGRPELGPFDNTVMHSHLYRELQNAINADANGRLSMAGRFNAGISAGFLATPDAAINNYIGGLYYSHTLGTNPAELFKKSAEIGLRIKNLKKGERLPAIDDIGHLMQSKLSALEFGKAMNWQKMQAVGFGHPGMVEKLGDAYRDVLQHPGGQKWLGLDGFQAVEDILKLSNYELALEKGMSKREAIEFTRNVVFDYSQLPVIARVARNHGLATFPGFPIFATARTVKTMVERPQVMLPYDRLPMAAWNAATEDDETKTMAAISMAPYQRDLRSIPIRRRDTGQGEVYDTLAFNHIAPTNVLDRGMVLDSVIEGVATGGIWRGPIDASIAWMRGDGEAVLSGQYGQRVFDPGSGFASRAGQTGAFLVQQIMPAPLRNTVSYNPQREMREGVFNPASPLTGIAPELSRAAAPHLGEAQRRISTAANLEENAPAVYDWLNRNAFPMNEESAEEVRRGILASRDREERNLWHHVVGLLGPTPNPISLSMDTATYKKAESGHEVKRSYRVDTLNRDLDEQIRRLAEGRGDEEKIVSIQQEIQRAGGIRIETPAGVTFVTPEQLADMAYTDYLRAYVNRKLAEGEGQ